jgi:hypothetical protein
MEFQKTLFEDKIMRWSNQTYSEKGNRSVGDKPKVDLPSKEESSGLESKE